MLLKAVSFFKFVAIGTLIGQLAYGEGNSKEEAYFPIVEKKRFEMKDFKTTSGTVLPEVQVGWQSMGTLNQNKDNVILVSHYLTGTSHFAGKYSKEDKRAGYWNYIIGPGKAVDTNIYFVLSIDSLANVNINNPNVITTGPASINPKTGKPYGADFPVITARDIVNVQHALLTSLGIKKLHSTMGASMGSHVSLEWANAYPNMVDRVISVVGHGGTNAWSKTQLGNWSGEIMRDPKWNDGQYYDAEYPLKGMTGALRGLLLSVSHGHAYSMKYEEALEKDRAPWHDIRAQFSSTKSVDKTAAARAPAIDANSYLYLTRLCQLFRLGHGKSIDEGIEPVQAKILLLPSRHDEILGPYMTKDFYTRLLMQEKRVIYDEIVGPWGHIDGLIAIGTKSEVIEAFLASS